jgi:flagellar export protein FliJ
MNPKTLKRMAAIKERLRQVHRAELLESESQVRDAEHSVASEVERQAGAFARMTGQGECSANELLLRAEQIEQTNLALKRAKAELHTREQTRDERRDVVGEATREVRALEALHERAAAVERRETEHREQRELDESSARKVRNR